jgi:hypothetical protein
MVVTMREAWTDERLDDLANRMDESFRDVRADIRSLQGEVGKAREDLGELRGEMNARFDGLNRTLQVGFGLVGTFLVALVGLIGTQL